VGSANNDTPGGGTCRWEERVVALAFGDLAATDREAVRTHLDDCDDCLLIVASAKRARWWSARHASEERAVDAVDTVDASAAADDTRGGAAVDTVDASAALLALLLAHTSRRRQRRHVHGAGAALPAALHAIPTRPGDLEVQMVGRPYVDAVGTVHVHLRSTDWSPAHCKLVHVKLGSADVHVFGVPSSVDAGDWEVLFRLETLEPESLAERDIDPVIFSLEVHEA